MSSPPVPRRRRVPALAPDDRRAALIAATLPLLRANGIAVSTRQIAEAAGVAEGTIFRVFPDKESLIRATVASALDPAPMLRLLGEIPADAGLRERLTVAATLLGRRAAVNAPLLAAVRSTATAGGRPCVAPPVTVRSALAPIADAIAALLEPDRARLAHPPDTIAGLLMSMVISSVRVGWGEADGILTPADLVSVLLDGVLLTPNPTDPRIENRC